MFDDLCVLAGSGRNSDHETGEVGPPDPGAKVRGAGVGRGRGEDAVEGAGQEGDHPPARRGGEELRDRLRPAPGRRVRRSARQTRQAEGAAAEDHGGAEA
eukprot:677604-Pyramimonas_sp.AAC.1